MTNTPRVLSLASAATLLLALSQPGLAAEETAATSVVPAPEAAAPAAAAAETAAAAAPAAGGSAAPGAEPAPAAEAPATTEAPAATPTPAEIARSRAEARQARRAEQDAERNQRYVELRQRAAEVGLELPETPPWEAAMPDAPAMPSQAGAAAPDWQAMRQEREAMRERFKSMTPEERKAMRDAHWQKMRERAAERGMEMPETPPWEEAEKRYKAAQEQFDRYRKIVDEMTEEQLEAARALFGHSEDMPQPMQPMAPQMPRQMPPQMPQGGYGYGYGPQGGYPGYGPYQGGPGAAGPGSMPYYEGGMEQAPPPPRGAVPY